jgi:hypothetical protein
LAQGQVTYSAQTIRFVRKEPFDTKPQSFEHPFLELFTHSKCMRGASVNSTLYQRRTRAHGGKTVRIEEKEEFQEKIEFSTVYAKLELCRWR